MRFEIDRRRALRWAVAMIVGSTAAVVACSTDSLAPTEAPGRDAGLADVGDDGASDSGSTSCEPFDRDAGGPSSCENDQVATSKDPCLASGLACGFIPFSGVSGDCRPPQDRDLCDPSLCGVCGPTADCVVGAEGAPKGLGRCLRRCTTSAECGDPMFSCATVANAGRRCTLRPCKNAGSACDADAAGDGDCHELLELDLESGTATVASLACVATGPREVDESCTFARGPGGVGSLCGHGLVCKAGLGDGEGFCRPRVAPGVTKCDGVVFQSEYILHVHTNLVDGSSVCMRPCSLDDAGAGDAGAGDAGAGDAGAGQGACPAGQRCISTGEVLPGEDEERTACFGN
jgi:hypothetical protein